VKAALRERNKLFALVGVFAVFEVVHSFFLAKVLIPVNLKRGTADLLTVAAVVVSLASVIPLLVTYRPSAIPKLLELWRYRAARVRKGFSLASASKSVSGFAAALSITPLLYGIMLLVVTGDQIRFLVLIPATLVLAAVGWFVVGRTLKDLQARGLS
jgi:hypothetical protein